MSMRHQRYFEIEERVLSFRAKQLEAWKKGNKSIAPPYFAVPPIVRNQPAYHFAETLALRHYYDTEGWQGFSSYALGAQYPNSERRAAGRRKVEEIIPPKPLALLRAVRSASSKTYRGAGEPDLFLFKEDHIGSSGPGCGSLARSNFELLAASEANMEWLAAELRETGGEASVWGAEALTPSREKVIRDFFLDQVNGEYRKIIQAAAQARTEKQLRDLWARYNRLRTQDYLRSPLAMEAKAACERQARVLRQEEDAA